jgi:serine/threonine protein kinase
MTLTRGTRLGPYEVLELVGAGGMGEVYRAHDPRIGRDVAIKILPAAYASDPDRLRRFELETRATGLLNHPNILTIYDTGRLEPGEPSSAPFIVTELLEGWTLREELTRGHLSQRRAIEYAVQIARGLAAAHAKGIVHRDLKPENVFVMADHRVKILDFGIAKLRAPDGHGADASTTASATVAGLVVGTVDYMSPEQARGEAIDHRSDLFALGVILYEMLTGERPFKGATPADRVSALLRDEPARLPVNSQVSGNIDRTIRHSLEKVPDRRFQSANDFIFDLETLPVAPSGSSTIAIDRVRGQPTTRTVLLAASILTVCAAGAWLYMTGSRPSRNVRRSVAATRVTPFLASDALEDHPAWSPTGNLMAYVSDAAGSADVWICDPSGTNPINLTAAFSGTDSMPAWSPDGQRLAFYSDRDGGGVYTMNALGGDVRRVIPIKPGVLYTFSLTWSRDNSLVYTNFHDQGKKDVFRIAPSGAPASCLTCGLSDRGARSGELSPSGDMLLYKTGEMGARGALQILHLVSQRVVRVFDQADRPRWSADGRRVIFISGQDGTPDLWQIEIDPATGNPAESGACRSTQLLEPLDRQNAG